MDAPRFVRQRAGLWSKLFRRIVRPPIGSAESQYADAMQPELEEFFRLVLPEWEEWLITDESTVWDFNWDDGTEVRERIQAAYGVQISRGDLDLYLWALITKLNKQRCTPKG